ncbi:dof zinc finger protein DOF1.7 [Brachypodium distachyon]|uniref:Dof zinc finger protein n=1 Tax=Brachypodium distachyon TaxID=15368 RepID=A0A0Q3NBG0_BRADI|nr:dof zinc finger protein DOF1.7 [Brachypodium distachyon]KQK14158.2 hypothetical protein BRADI_1g14570v3 [Brachypodium distachyon]|eukprot:XP_003559674.2 dof zinc finger protein DOF1.7 [Brachypodium distachyon]
MPGQVMEAPLHQLPQLTTQTAHPNYCKQDATAASTMADMARFLQQQQQLVQPTNQNPNANTAREQCPRCASHDTKFCYYNNYNTSQPRHFCRACRRYWTLGGSLRNVPIGGSTRKRLRPAPQQPLRHRPPVHFASPPPIPQQSAQSQQGLLGSLFALGGAPLLLEGRVGFDLGLGLPGLAGQLGGLTGSGGGGAGEVGLHSLGLRGGGQSAGPGPTSSLSAPLLWPSSLFENNGGNNVETWKVSGGGAAATAMWAPAPEFSSAATVPQVGGVFHGGAQML